jgi:tetratricopeptide (TPR) repeat protein
MQLKSLLKSFEYDSPRAEVCCKIAMLYKENKDFKKAIAWYEVAANLQMPAANTTSIVADYWGYIPCIELSWCYWKTGNLIKAIEYNNRAGRFKPDSPTYLTNKKILEELLGT